MIRFVVGPDDQVVTDIAGRLPGRGMWVTATRDALQAAVKRKQFAHSAKAKVTVPEEIVDQVEALLTARCLDLLGMGRRAGNLVSGLFQVEKAMGAPKGRHVAALVLASDAKKDGRRRAGKMANGIPVITLFSGPELDLALGKVNVVHAALIEGGLARAILDETARLAGFRNETDVMLKVEKTV
jgi:predicted RNA-binding protein YlxR (DUF448 family)